MRRDLLNFTVALALLLPTAKASAQNASPGITINPELMKMSSAERAKAQKEFEANYPLVAKQQVLTPRQSAFPDGSRRLFSFPTLSKTKKATPRLVNASATIWANLATKSDWTSSNNGPFGYYSFSPVSPLTYTSLFETSDQSPAKNGVQYADNGHIYGISLDTRYSSYGLIFEYLYDTDTETGVTTRSSLTYRTNVNLAAYETAQAEDGTVYGQFYSADGTSLEWGTVDYSTRTRTTIAPSTHDYVALGITKEGQLYGVATDGNLYKVNKETGEETLVGATGLIIERSNGRFYAQTGEIDPKDNTFYWFAIDANQNTGLYEVNLQTGAATLISTANGDQLYGMIVPPATPAGGAPAKITDAAASFQGASLHGQITFTAPTKTYSGADLTGTVNYTIIANDSVIATGKASAGQKVNADVTLPKSGNYRFVITTSNDAGESQKAKVAQWIGYDVPLPVSNVKVSKNGQAVTVSWNRSTGSVHNGTLGTPLTYDVYRVAEGVYTKVGTNIADSFYVDNVESTNLSYYTYAVRAVAEGQESSLVSSEGIVVGIAVEPDWTETFDTQNDISMFTILDANNDGSTWRYSSSMHAAYSNYNRGGNMDDWLFTPPIHLKPGRLYTVSFKAQNQWPSFANSFEVKWGNDTTVAAMTNTILETTIPTPGGGYQNYSADISVEKEGNYYIGFHDNTPADASQLYIYLDDISVENGALFTAPASVSNLTVTPGNRGELSATISFDVPSKSVGGANIDKVDSLQISRDGQVIATLAGASAGTSLTYSDNAVPSNGVHSYVVTPYLAGEFGQKTSASAYIGIDVPKDPENITLLDNQNSVLAMWNPISEVGANGGYVDRDGVTVTFYSLLESMFGFQVGDSIGVSAPGASRAEIAQNTEETTEVDGKTQTLYQVAARASNEIGHGDYVGSDAVVIGPSIKLPYKESLKNGNLENGFAWIEGNAQYAANNDAAGWIVYTDNSADNDGGSFLWHAYTSVGSSSSHDYTITKGDEVSINTPKISLRGAANPKLYFSLYATASDPAKLKVLVQTPDGVDHEVSTFDLSTTAQNGWTTKSLDLGSYTSERYVILKFRGVADGEAAYIGLDNINVFDQLDHNLAAVGIDAPASITEGTSGKVNVYVENYGANAAKDYSVVLYADNKAVDTVNVSKELDVLSTDTVALTLPVTINHKDSINVKATVVYASDLKADDNTTETKVVGVAASEYQAVADLSATQTGNDVNLKWSKPSEPAPVETTEDFESYSPFDTQLGSWTTVDGDKGLAAGFDQSATYPTQGTQFAFEAFNPNAMFEGEDDLTTTNPGLAPHSGKQFAGAPWARDAATQKPVAANNWLISPELSGQKQTINFFAFNLAASSNNQVYVYTEKFDVLYSTTGKDTVDFVKIESDVADGSNAISQGVNWKEFSVELPEGAKYFAIHHYTDADHSFLFGIDDVKFVKGGVGAYDSIIAYNVYRDGQFIGSVKGTLSNVLSESFTDNAAADGSHVYNVTVVYQSADGKINESGFSNDASITVTGIDAVEANAEGKYDVYTIDGKAVRLGAKSLNGLKSGVYIINDRKYVIR